MRVTQSIETLRWARLGELMSWIILIDLRDNNDHFVNLEDEHGNIAQFPTEEAARAGIADHPLTAYPCYAISVDEQEVSSL